jgi:hypothetical protein
MTRRLPLVFAAPDTIESARELLPGVLENEVSRAIHAGRATRRASAGLALGRGDLVVHGRGWAALVSRARSPVTGRKSWLVVQVEHEEPTNEGGNDVTHENT